MAENVEDVVIQANAVTLGGKPYTFRTFGVLRSEVKAQTFARALAALIVRYSDATDKLAKGEDVAQGIEALEHIERDLEVAFAEFCASAIVEPVDVKYFDLSMEEATALPRNFMRGASAATKS